MPQYSRTTLDLASPAAVLDSPAKLRIAGCSSWSAERIAVHHAGRMDRESAREAVRGHRNRLRKALMPSFFSRISSFAFNRVNMWCDLSLVR